MMLFRFLPKLIYAWGASLYLLTIGVFSAENRLLIYKICCHFGWDRKRRTPLLPLLPAGPILGSPLEIALYDPVCKEGNVTFHELALIVSLAKSINAEQIFEIGTFDGRTARNLAAAAPEQGHVYTLDLPLDDAGSTTFNLAKGEFLFVDKPAPGARFAGTPEAAKITQLLGDSAKFDFTPYTGRMDFIFIDGSHAYDYVLSDSEKAIKMLKPGGLILWHDYTGDWPELTHALNQLFKTDARFAGMRHIEGSSLALLQTTG